MHRSWITCLLLVLVLNASVSRADPAPAQPCQYRESAAQDGSEPVETGGSPAVIWLQSTRPAEGGRIDSATVLEVDVEFRVANFEPGMFFLMPQFPTTYGSMYPDKDFEMPRLQSARGRAHLCVPLAEVFEDPAVRWPLSVILSINQIQSDGSSRPVAESKMVSFSAFDLPTGVTAHHAAAPPEEYVRALMKAFTFFEVKRALDSVCGRRIPEMLESFARVYPMWKTRHAATINLVNSLQLEQFKLTGKYGDDAAARIFEGIRSSIAGEFEKLPETSLRETCRAAAIELADQDFDINGVIGNELRIVRKWQASRPIPPS